MKRTIMSVLVPVVLLGAGCNAATSVTGPEQPTPGPSSGAPAGPAPSSISSGHEPGRTVYSEVLSRGSVKGWTTKTTSEVELGFDQFGYFIRLKKKDVREAVRIPLKQAVPQAYVQAQVQSFHDGYAGVFCGSKQDYTDYYSFAITETNAGGIFHVVNGTANSLWGFEAIPGLDATKANVVGAYCKGTTLAMYVNGQLVKTVTAPDPPKGGVVGLVERSFTTKSFAEFQNVFVSAL